MNRLFAAAAALIMAATVSAQAQMELPASRVARQMGVGWNLGNTMEANQTDLGAETAWQNTRTTQALIDFVKAQGFSSVRIPTSWYVHCDKRSMQIDPRWMARVREIVDYCIHDSLYVVLNDHWDGGWLEDSFCDVSAATVCAKSDTLRAIWRQVASEFQSYDEHLLFAGLNEPSHSYDNGHFTDEMVKALLSYEQTFVDAVRTTGGNNRCRILVVQGPATNIDETVKPTYAYQLPTDVVPERMMVEVHYYDPWNFCGMEQDETWGKMAFYWGKANHADGSGRNAEWGEENHLREKFTMMEKTFVSRGYPVILGEFGANWRHVGTAESQQKHDASIYSFFRNVTREALCRGIVPMVWDINHTEWPTMTVIDRERLGIFCEPAMRGIRAAMAR